jgi:RAD54-like protein 2
VLLTDLKLLFVFLNPFPRYGQKKQCFIYRLVTDNSLEKKIYDRQIGKQGTADRVVDELNPEARLSLKEVTSLVCDDEDDPPVRDFGESYTAASNITDEILGEVLQKWGHSFTKDPFQHDTLLLEGKDSGLSKAEKRMAQRLYEKAKLDGNMQYRRQNYSSYYPKMPVPIPTMDNNAFSRMNPMYSSPRPSSIPPKHTNSPPRQGNMNLLAEAFAQGKLVCKEMVLTKDVTIARNQMPDGTGETTPTVLPSGTRVKLIKTPKGIYMQTPEGKILRIHSAAPATPASPSTIAAALGLNLKTPFPGAQDSSTGLASFSGGSKSSLMEQSMLKRIRGNIYLKFRFL